MPERPLHPETLAVRAQTPRSPEREHSVPLFLTSSFVFESAEHARALFGDEVEGNIYSRYSNPNSDELARKLCAPGGRGGGDGDGERDGCGLRAARRPAQRRRSRGGRPRALRLHAPAPHPLAAALGHLLRLRRHRRMPGRPWQAAIRPETRLVFVETPSNPGLDILDLGMLGEVAKEHGVLLVVDNCFATPYLQQPVRFGADLVVHSATKFLDGQGRTLGGAVVGSPELIAEIRFFARHTGPAISPFNAWVLSKSLETLAVRMDRHCASALAIARHFEGHRRGGAGALSLPAQPPPATSWPGEQMSAGGGHRHPGAARRHRARRAAFSTPSSSSPTAPTWATRAPSSRTRPRRPTPSSARRSAARWGSRPDWSASPWGWSTRTTSIADIEQAL